MFFLVCILVIIKIIKCVYVRSVYFFIDFLLYFSMQSTVYLCSDMDSFSQGLCLSCRKSRCNTLGYYVRQEYRGKKSRKFFFVTRVQVSFKGECGWFRVFRRVACSYRFEGLEVFRSFFLERFRFCYFSVFEIVQISRMLIQFFFFFKNVVILLLNVRRRKFDIFWNSFRVRFFSFIFIVFQDVRFGKF